MLGWMAPSIARNTALLCAVTSHNMWSTHTTEPPCLVTSSKLLPCKARRNTMMLSVSIVTPSLKVIVTGLDIIPFEVKPYTATTGDTIRLFDSGWMPTIETTARVTPSPNPWKIATLSLAVIVNPSFGSKWAGTINAMLFCGARKTRVWLIRSINNCNSDGSSFGSMMVDAMPYSSWTAISNSLIEPNSTIVGGPYPTVGDELEANSLIVEGGFGAITRHNVTHGIPP
mmetsp:Transcript_49293/g.88033  ORF Transcript_49293/g.88033 Transcript_49293/m.88033 type:complete len:228 (-) Transcript_49293:62-745(-)